MNRNLKFALMAAAAISGLLVPASASANGGMFTASYVDAVRQSKLRVDRSFYRSCVDITDEIEDSGFEDMAAQTATQASKWNREGKCLLHYDASPIPRFNLIKDQLEWTCGCAADVQQQPQPFDSNALVVKIMSSRNAFFSRVKPPHLGKKKVYAYYAQGRGAAIAYPYNSFSYKGPKNLFVVDDNHLVCAYGVFWTSGYVVRSGDFTVIPDKLYLKGARCGNNSEIIFR